MACDHWGIEEEVEVYSFYNAAMLTLVHVYYAECVLKIIGLGKHYFTDPWCQLDFGLVLLAAIDEFAELWLASLLGGDGGSGVLRILRV